MGVPKVLTGFQSCRFVSLGPEARASSPVGSGGDTQHRDPSPGGNWAGRGRTRGPQTVGTGISTGGEHWDCSGDGGSGEGTGRALATQTGGLEAPEAGAPG